MRLFCFLAAVSSVLAPVSAAADPAIADLAGANLSVVRLGRDGHLVRVTMQSARKSAVLSKKQSQTPVPLVIPPVFTGGQTASSTSSIAELVQDAAQRYQVDPLLVHSVIHVESGFNPRAVSDKGAQGLMQLIPATAQRFGATDPFDPKQNIDAGVHYLRYLQDRFSNDLALSIAAYNAGEGAVTRYNSVPPYPETVNYVQKVTREYTGRKKIAKPSRTDASQTPAQISSSEAQRARICAANPYGNSTDLEAARSAPRPFCATSPEEAVRHVEEYVDSEGRLYLRTR